MLNQTDATALGSITSNEKICLNWNGYIFYARFLNFLIVLLKFMNKNQKTAEVRSLTRYKNSDIFCLQVVQKQLHSLGS